MKIYHGSENIIEKPVFGFGKTTNDYGKGFYCTEEIELAKEWACGKNTDGFVNEYELNITGLSVLNLNDKKYNILNWLAILTKNRSYWQERSIAEEAKDYLQKNFLIDIQDYDIIIGNRADDSYFSFAQDFISGVISVQQLEEAMKLGKLGEQIVLKSKKAFDKILYKESTEVYAEEYYLKKTNRDREARRQYRLTKAATTHIDDIFMLDIMRRGMTNESFSLR